MASISHPTALHTSIRMSNSCQKFEMSDCPTIVNVNGFLHFSRKHSSAELVLARISSHRHFLRQHHPRPRTLKFFLQFIRSTFSITFNIFLRVRQRAGRTLSDSVHSSGGTDSPDRSGSGPAQQAETCNLKYILKNS